MPIFYRVTQRFYSNGSFSSDISKVSAKTIPENRFEETPMCDIYEDYFSDRLEAVQFYESALGGA